jgi:hypothetical protein
MYNFATLSNVSELQCKPIQTMVRDGATGMDSASVSAPNNLVAPMHMRLAVSGAQEQTPYQSQLKASRICTKIARSWSAGVRIDGPRGEG